jgi:HSP20 family molecular chaperone IbpA
MTDRTGYNSDCLIYPGEYSLRAETEERLNRFKNLPASNTVVFPVNMYELESEYRLEIPLPGIRKEDIFIESSPGSISISVIARNGDKMEKERRLHEFDVSTVRRLIVLPADADAEFISARFKRGLLILDIPKGSASPAYDCMRVVVY